MSDNDMTKLDIARANVVANLGEAIERLARAKRAAIEEQYGWGYSLATGPNAVMDKLASAMAWSIKAEVYEKQARDALRADCKRHEGR